MRPLFQITMMSMNEPECQFVAVADTHSRSGQYPQRAGRRAHKRGLRDKQTDRRPRVYTGAHKAVYEKLEASSSLDFDESERRGPPGDGCCARHTI